MDTLAELQLIAIEEATQQWRAKYHPLFESPEAEKILRKTFTETIAGLIALAQQRWQEFDQNKDRAAESAEYREEVFGQLASLRFSRMNAMFQEICDRLCSIGNTELSKAVEQAMAAARAQFLSIVFWEIRTRLESSLTWTGVSDETAKALVRVALQS